MLGGGEHRHVGTDLGDDDLRAAATDVGDGHEQLDHLLEGAMTSLMRSVSAAMSASSSSMWASIRPNWKAWWSRKRLASAFASVGSLARSLPLAQVRQQLGVGHPSNEGPPYVRHRRNAPDDLVAPDVTEEWVCPTDTTLTSTGHMRWQSRWACSRSVITARALLSNRQPLSTCNSACRS